MQNNLGLNRAQRRQIEAAKRTEAPKIAARVGVSPAVTELRNLLDELEQHGAIDARQATVVRDRAEVWEGSDERARLVALDRLASAAAPRLARKAVASLEALIPGQSRIELAALSPTEGGRRTIAAELPADSPRLIEELSALLPTGNLHVGRERRAPQWSGHAAAKTEDIAESRIAVFDFDRPPGLSDDEWIIRRAEIQHRLEACDPCLILSTGGGLHGWFRLVPTSDRAEMAQRAVTLNATMRAVGADPIADMARIVRLPWTINFPDAKKRAKGRTIALVHPIYENHAAEAWTFEELDQAMRQAFGVQAGTAAQPGATSTPAGQAFGRDRAPSTEIATRVLQALPNDSDGPFQDRAAWITVLHAYAGATGNVPEARSAWLEWSSQFDPDTTEAERLWDTLNFDRLSGGWRNLRALLAKHGSASDRQAIQAAVIQSAFGDEPDDDAMERMAVAAKGSPGRKTIAEKLANFVRQNGELWVDKAGDAYVRFRDQNGATRDYALASRAGRLAVQSLIGRSGTYPTDEQMKQVLGILTAMARTAGEVHEAHLRFAAEQDTIYLHLDGPRNDVLVSEPGVWRIVPAELTRVRFVAPDGAEAIPSPSAGTGQKLPDLLRKHMALPAMSQADPDDPGVQGLAAILAFICGAVMPARRSMKPVLIFDGAAGSGKTTAVHVIGGLLDPHAHALGTAPRDGEHLSVLAKNRALVRLDNISSFSAAMSDLLCNIASGGAFQRRELFTNGELASWELSRPVVISAISLSLASDLEDRSVRVTLERRSTPWSERAAHAAFEADRPTMLGALADMLAAGLALLPKIDMDKAPVAAPRFRDATELAEACARTLGWRDWLLTEALVAARREGQQALFAGDPLAQKLVRVLKTCAGHAWTGTAGELLAQVEAVGGPTWGAKGRPSTPTQLSARLTRIEPAWIAAGGVIQRGFRGRGDAKQKTIALTASPQMIQEAHHADPFDV